jgi:hypothetical protein
LNDWLASIQSDGLDTARISKEREPAADLIESIAESLIRGASGIERKLLSKSLQETLFYCAGIDANIDYSRFKIQFTRHLARHGAASIIQLFLSLYVFNFVWIEVSESFRATARSTYSFEKDMEGVEAICKEAVDLVWKRFERTKRPLDLSAARELMLDIDRQLRGVRVLDSG